MIDPGTATIIGAGLSGIGSAFGGGSQAKAQKAQTKEQAREFNLGSQQSAAHSLETSGLRDKLLAIMGQSATQGFQQFQPRDAFNPNRNGPGGAPQALAQGQMGGPTPGSLNLPSNYKMGDGGVNPDIFSQLLYHFGYRGPDDAGRLTQEAKDAANNKKYQDKLAPRPPFQMPPSYNPGSPMGGGLVNPGGRSY